MDKTKEKSNKKLLIIIIAILVIAALAVGGVIVYNSFFAEKPLPSNGVVGKISDGWDTGLEDETAPQSSGIQIPGYGTAVMKAGDESLSLSIDTVNNYEAINTTAEPGEYGYHLCTFLYGSDSKTQPVTLALNQNALYGQTLSDIAGDYSGTITFHSALFERS